MKVRKYRQSMIRQPRQLRKQLQRQQMIRAMNGTNRVKKIGIALSVVMMSGLNSKINQQVFVIRLINTTYGSE